MTNPRESSIEPPASQGDGAPEIEITLEMRQAGADVIEDLRDVVWMPAHLQFENGGESVALIPTRYPGSAASAGSGPVQNVQSSMTTFPVDLRSGSNWTASPET
jgi:hypothetical protein